MRPICALSFVAFALVTIPACSSSTPEPAGDAQTSTVPDVLPGEAAAETAEAGEAGATADGGTLESSDDAPPSDDALGGDSGDAQSATAVLDLNDVSMNPSAYTWFDFKPNIKKLILAGTADSKHIAILWYTITDGGVALHYHAKTESVYVINGTQTDGKGVYPTGTVYFNPPGSGHEVTKSSGFFLLAYAAPPDFADTNLIQDYTPVRIDTTSPNLTTIYTFDQKAVGIRTFTPPLDATGGLSAQIIATTSADAYVYTGNYVVVLGGSCDIQGATYGKNMLVVGRSTDPLPYSVAASKDSSCSAMGVSF